MIRLRELEREAQASRLIYDTFLETYKRSDEQEELQEAEARILSYAAAPRAPSAPNVPLLFILGGILSLFAGLILSVIAEKMDNACRDPEQLEALGYPCYGMVPVVRGVRAPRLARYTLANPASDAAEAVRTLRMSMNLRAFKGEQKARVLSLTSSFAAEGKTTLSLWLARMAARAGERVIIIDTDLRAPAIHRAMGVRNNSTLVDYLSGQKELSQVIYQDRETGLHMIFGASVPNTALDLVNSPRMRGLIEELRGSYDLVILDTPACLPVSDSRVMASLSDLVFYIVAWDQTARGAITAGIKQFADIGIENMAFVFTHVDMRRHAREHYGTAQRYYRSYKGQGA
jgi:succinoglycan biosynthesis transport protein ExoP